MNDNDRITAGELRAAGVNIDSEIPDCAWIPRTAMVFGGEPYIRKEKDCTVITVGIPIKINAPFRWVTLEAIIEKAVDLIDTSSPRPVVPWQDEIT